MQAFTGLYFELDRSTSTLHKVRALAHYLKSAAPQDAAWAVYLLAGGKLRQSVPTRVLRASACARAGLADWLFEECYQSVGDLAETIALVLGPGKAQDTSSLGEWMQRIESCRGQPEETLVARLHDYWAGLDSQQRFVMNKLITGGFRVGVSRLLVTRALAQAFEMDEKLLAQRLIGYLSTSTSPSAHRFKQILGAAEHAEDRAQPYPFFLAHPWPQGTSLPEPVDDWQLEWKWDGIRCQLVFRQGNLHLWSRGEELITPRFPELQALAARLPADCVIDGELLAWSPQDQAVASFAVLQKRLNRKQVGARLLAQAPVRLMAYDLLEIAGHDLRNTPLRERRQNLEALVEQAAHAVLGISETLAVPSWEAAKQQRAGSRARGVEGLMLKHRDSTYGIGRTKSDTSGGWWKWKIDPLTIDAVLIYAQRGHGRRANLFSDYTFALWSHPPGHEQRHLVPFAKAYSGLTDEEMREVDAVVRKTTREKFGPVHSVEPTMVFELGFEAVNQSARHKSGVAVRFPRMLRIRTDKPVQQADELVTLRAMANPVSGSQARPGAN
jgi:DNA ligase 1